MDWTTMCQVRFRLPPAHIRILRADPAALHGEWSLGDTK